MRSPSAAEGATEIRAVACVPSALTTRSDAETVPSRALFKRKRRPVAPENPIPPTVSVKSDGVEADGLTAVTTGASVTATIGATSVAEAGAGAAGTWRLTPGAVTVADEGEAGGAVTCTLTAGVASETPRGVPTISARAEPGAVGNALSAAAIITSAGDGTVRGA